VFSRFGPEKRMQLYDRGIRRRLAPMIGNREHIELAYSVMFSLPGTPVIRYGDEIGMGDDLSLPEREAVRTPMQWTPEEGSGFSTAKKTVHPIITRGAYGCEHVNVEKQRRDPASLLNWTAGLIRMRKECPEIGWGSWRLLNMRSPGVLGIQYEWRGQSVVVIHNFTEKRSAVSFNVRGEGKERLTDLQSEEESRGTAQGRHRLALDGYGSRWFRVGGLNYALARESESPVE
jgi:maltose alpha-D-glucosyltransferase/alpha-amylase